jgi:hypothetical protein
MDLEGKQPIFATVSRLIVGYFLCASEALNLSRDLSHGQIGAAVCEWRLRKREADDEGWGRPIERSDGPAVCMVQFLAVEMGRRARTLGDVILSESEGTVQYLGMLLVGDMYRTGAVH